MEKKKRQIFKIGSFVKIKLSENRLIFGRLLPGYHIGVYDNVFQDEKDIPSIDNLIAFEIYLYVRIFKDVITKGIIEIIGFKELVQKDLDKMPPHFKQDKVIIEDCIIYYEDGREYKVTPQECIGLEGPITWEAGSLIDRINDHYAGNKNPYEELHKVILSENDPRYQNPNVRWDFSERKFYKE